jgi:hypothetical protein
MVRYVDALCLPNHIAPPYFARGKVYPLAIKKSWWSKKVSVYKRSGYYDYMQEGTFHKFNSWPEFDIAWQIIEKQEEE